MRKKSEASETGTKKRRTRVVLSLTDIELVMLDDLRGIEIGETHAEAIKRIVHDRYNHFRRTGIGGIVVKVLKHGAKIPKHEESEFSKRFHELEDALDEIYKKQQKEHFVIRCETVRDHRHEQ